MNKPRSIMGPVIMAIGMTLLLTVQFMTYYGSHQEKGIHQEIQTICHGVGVTVNVVTERPLTQDTINSLKDDLCNVVDTVGKIVNSPEKTNE